MRWTNYFEHPGDNRYYVFTFPDLQESDDFKRRLEAQGIEYEAHCDEEGSFQPDGETKPAGAIQTEAFLFAVNRRNFKEALRQNHLLKATTRAKFIQSTGLRWTLLLITGTLVALAVLGFFRNAHAQGWEMAIEAGYLPALDALGASSITTVEDTLGEPSLTTTWNPTGGSRLAVRLDRSLNDAWRISTGITVQRMGANWNVAFEDVDASGERTGELVEQSLRLRGVRYRIPVLGITSVKLSEKQRLMAGGGLGADFTPSDVFAAGSLQADSAYHDLQIAENRTRIWNVPLLAELGWAYRPDGSAGWNPNAQGKRTIRGVYFGVHWSRELLQNRWGEAIWKHELSEQRTPFWMGPTSVAFVVRLTLS